MGIIYCLRTHSQYELLRYYGTEAKDRNGPVGFSELKDLFAEGNITAKTKVWAQGMEGWRLLHQVLTPIITLIIGIIDKDMALGKIKDRSSVIVLRLLSLCKYRSWPAETLVSQSNSIIRSCSI